jgi:hypothetical protein
MYWNLVYFIGILIKAGNLIKGWEWNKGSLLHVHTCLYRMVTNCVVRGCKNTTGKKVFSLKSSLRIQFCAIDG